MMDIIIKGKQELIAENSRLKELNRELVEVLRKLDFIEVMSYDCDMICFCPICKSYSNEHNKDCRLQAVLAKAEARGE